MASLRDRPNSYMWDKKGNPYCFMTPHPQNKRSLKSYPTHLHASPLYACIIHDDIILGNLTSTTFYTFPHGYGISI